MAEAAQPTDATYQRSVAVGVSLLYSSANSRSFFFDDFAVTDATAPLLLRAVPVATRQVDVAFNEAVDPASAGLLANYRLQSGAVPTAAHVLQPTTPPWCASPSAPILPPPNVLEVRNVADLYGNVAAGPLTASFAGAARRSPQVGDLIITEIFADETPQVGLPLSEYMEIYNRSATGSSAWAGCGWASRAAPAAILPDTAKLLPGQYAMVCGSTRVPQFAALRQSVRPHQLPLAQQRRRPAGAARARRPHAV